jgi:hypothetical protein
MELDGRNEKAEPVAKFRKWVRIPSQRRFDDCPKHNC